MAIDPPGVGANVKITDTDSPDGIQAQPSCCVTNLSGCSPEDLALCCFLRGDFCVGGSNDGLPCTGDVDCPGGECFTCDDDPKMQNETTISVHPLDPDVLLSAFNDASKRRPGDPETNVVGVGFAISRDRGVTWERLQRLGGNYPCSPDDLLFTTGHAFTRDDLCFDWPAHQADPATAIGASDYLYVVGLNTEEDTVFMSRLQLTDPLTSPWETASVPLAIAANVVDKPFVSADALAETAYVHWSTKEGGQIFPDSVLRLSVSQGPDCDFFDDPAACPPGIKLIEGLRLSHRESAEDAQDNAQACGIPCTWGTASVVAPDGTVHIIWNQGAGVDNEAGFFDHVDQLRYRKGVWTNGELSFVPPLPDPPALACNLPSQDNACERGIVFNQPGFPEGYRDLHRGLAETSVNLNKILPHPSIALDRNNISDGCGRGGTLYVAYAAEEPPCPNEICNDWFADCADPQIQGRTIDSNIYVVHSRDDGETWSAPVRVTTFEFSVGPTTCTDPSPQAPVRCGVHHPFQFFPWIAVDGEGRVGVMYFDTTIDDPAFHPDGDRCDANVIYEIRFAWSLDGGVTWEDQITVSEEPSETQVLDPPDGTLFWGDYAGMTAASDGTGPGVFHPIWTDLTEWDDPARFFPLLTPGDVYTATVTISEPVFSMGDYDRDGDVDMKDYVNFNPCRAAGSPIPPLCEILDFNRNNVIDHGDATLFYDCFTGRGLSGGDSGSQSAPNLDAMAGWVNETIPSPERAILADIVWNASPSTDATEAALMQTFADTIDAP